MEDSGAILCQISLLKDMLDQVNEEIEANYEITREIESEIVKCCEFESAMAVRESELTKSLYLLHFEIHGLRTVTADSRASTKCLEEELSSLGVKRDEILNSVNNKREMFTSLCLIFQKSIDKGEDYELESLLSEKEHLENEVQLWTQKNNSLQNSVSAYLEDVLEDLRNSNSALHLEIESGKLENEKVLKDIDELKATLLSTISM